MHRPLNDFPREVECRATKGVVSKLMTHRPSLAHERFDIITGRGEHSVDGVAVIKPRIAALLATELQPGLGQLFDFMDARMLRPPAQPHWPNGATTRCRRKVPVLQGGKGLPRG